MKGNAEGLPVRVSLALSHSRESAYIRPPRQHPVQSNPHPLHHHDLTPTVILKSWLQHPGQMHNVQRWGEGTSPSSVSDHSRKKARTLGTQFQTICKWISEKIQNNRQKTQNDATGKILVHRSHTTFSSFVLVTFPAMGATNPLSDVASFASTAEQKLSYSLVLNYVVLSLL